MASIVPSVKVETDGKALFSEASSGPQNVGLKPKYSEAELTESLESFKREVLDTPIEFYESRLYDLTNIYVMKLDTSTISLKIVDEMHHIVKLKKREVSLDELEVDTINRNIEKVLARRPGALEEYRLFTGILELIEALAIKWNLYQISNYGYRLRGRALNIKVLDIAHINEHLFSMDIIFLSRVLKEYPFSLFTDEMTHQYAIVLHQVLIDLMTYMLQLNQADFETVPSISGYLAYQNPELYKKKFIAPDPYARESDYQSFYLPHTCWEYLMRTKAEANAMKLNKMIKEFELIYRTFEKSIITLIVTVPNKEL